MSWLTSGQVLTQLQMLRACEFLKHRYPTNTAKQVAFDTGLTPACVQRSINRGRLSPTSLQAIAQAYGEGLEDYLSQGKRLEKLRGLAAAEKQRRGRP